MVWIPVDLAVLLVATAALGFAWIGVIGAGTDNTTFFVPPTMVDMTTVLTDDAGTDLVGAWDKILPACVVDVIVDDCVVELIGIFKTDVPLDTFGLKKNVIGKEVANLRCDKKNIESFTA